MNNFPFSCGRGVCGGGWGGVVEGVGPAPPPPPPPTTYSPAAP